MIGMWPLVMAPPEYRGARPGPHPFPGHLVPPTSCDLLSWWITGPIKFWFFAAPQPIPGSIAAPGSPSARGQLPAK